MEWQPMKMMMIEQAEEELEILETQHPNRFNYLKLELKSFIQLIQSQNIPFFNNIDSFSPISNSFPSSSSVTTQASSSFKKRKKRKDGDIIINQKKKSIQRNAGVFCGSDSSPQGKVDRIEFVLEKAQSCLQKIQEFKTSFQETKIDKLMIVTVEEPKFINL